MKKSHIRDLLSEGLHLIPKHMHGGMIHFVDRGSLPGFFMRSMLEGNLEDAKLRADDQNVAGWGDWMIFLSDYLPPECHGTPEKVAKWVAQGGLSEDGPPKMQAPDEPPISQ